MSGLTPLPPVGMGGGGALPPVHSGGVGALPPVHSGGGCGGATAMVPAMHPPQQAAAPSAPGGIPWPAMPMLNPYEMAFDAGPPVPASRPRGKGQVSSSGGRRREAQQIYAIYWGQMKDRDAPVCFVYIISHTG